MPSLQTAHRLTTAKNSGWDSAARRQRRASAGTTAIRRAAWRQRPPVFAPRFAATAAGLRAAEEELGRLLEMHTAYATQPDITALWQGYIDQKAAAVSAQQLIVKRLAHDLPPRPPAVPRSAPREIRRHLFPNPSAAAGRSRDHGFLPGA